MRHSKNLLTLLVLGTLPVAACIVPADAGSQSLRTGADHSESWYTFQPDLAVSHAPFSKMQVNWKQRIDQPYVYVELVGSYTETGRLLPMIHRSMIDQGLTPAGPPFALFYDDPGVTPVERLVSRACVPVEQQVQVDESLSFDVLPSTTVVYGFAGGAYPEVPRAYPNLYQFMARSGWIENGPIRETYLVAPDSVQSFDDLVTEIQIPVTYAP